jgi:predicted component of type VI protein secretion system
MFALQQNEVVIGRARSATIRLDDDGVSRSHAKVTCLGSEVHIEDLGSANGTFVNLGARGVETSSEGRGHMPGGRRRAYPLAPLVPKPWPWHL